MPNLTLRLRTSRDCFSDVYESVTTGFTQSCSVPVQGRPVLRALSAIGAGRYRSGVTCRWQNVSGVIESLKVITLSNCERLARFTFEYALEHGRKKVTAIHKANIM